MLRFPGCGLRLGHRTATACILRLGLLKLRLLPVDLLAKLGRSGLILHNLRVHVGLGPAARYHLVLMLLVHLLLLSILSLLSRRVRRLISRDVPTHISLLLLLLLSHLLVIVNVLLLLGAEIRCVSLMLAAEVTLLLLVLLLVGGYAAAIRTGDALVAAVVGGGGVLGALTLVVFGAVGGPVDPITQGLTAAAEDGEGPEVAIAAEDLLPVLAARDVVQALVGVALHLQVLDRCLVRQGQLDVELEEHGHQDGDDPVQHERHLDNDILD